MLLPPQPIHYISPECGANPTCRVRRPRRPELLRYISPNREANETLRRARRLPTCRNPSTTSHPTAKRMNPVGRGLAPAATFPPYLTQPRSKSHLYDEAVRRERRTLQNVHLLNGLCYLTNALPRVIVYKSPETFTVGLKSPARNFFSDGVDIFLFLCYDRTVRKNTRCFPCKRMMK